MSNRRGFLKLLGLGVGGAIAAPVLANIPEPVPDRALTRKALVEHADKTFQQLPVNPLKYEDVSATLEEYGRWLTVERDQITYNTFRTDLTTPTKDAFLRAVRLEP